MANRIDWTKEVLIEFPETVVTGRGTPKVSEKVSGTAYCCLRCDDLDFLILVRDDLDNLGVNCSDIYIRTEHGYTHSNYLYFQSEDEVVLDMAVQKVLGLWPLLGEGIDSMHLDIFNPNDGMPSLPVLLGGSLEYVDKVKLYVESTSEQNLLFRANLKSPNCDTYITLMEAGDFIDQTQDHKFNEIHR